jgi:hypothetical protein
VKRTVIVLAGLLLGIAVPSVPAGAAMPKTPPDWSWTCASGKSAKVWFQYQNRDMTAPVVLMAAKNPCKTWIAIYWHNPDRSIYSRVFLAPGKKFNWDQAHIEANGADTPADGGFHVGRERNREACGGPNDSMGRPWAFHKRIYSYKDVRPVPECAS